MNLIDRILNFHKSVEITVTVTKLVTPKHAEGTPVRLKDGSFFRTHYKTPDLLFVVASIEAKTVNDKITYIYTLVESANLKGGYFLYGVKEKEIIRAK